MSDLTEHRRRTGSRYWQHNEPISCPHRKIMGWLGGPFWICLCRKCKRSHTGLKTTGTIWVQTKDTTDAA